MGLIRILDHVGQCYSGHDGQVIYNAIIDELKSGKPVSVSFEGIDSISTSFVNNAFIVLLDDISFEDIKRLLRFVHTTSQINDMLRSRFQFEAGKTRAARHPAYH